jgi:hypothetical protein
MLEGFLPTDMDDKWMVVTDTPDAQGNTVVRACRSWTSQEMYLLTIEAGNANETESKDWATIVKISWDEHQAGTKISEEKAKRSAISFCKVLLGCEMEV